MKPLPNPWRHALLTWAVALPALCLAAAASAAPVFAPFNGSGNAVVFDETTGEGGWVGSIEQDPFPLVAAPLSLVSVVLFTYDAALNTLTGSFEFTDSQTLDSTLFGTLLGSSFDDMPFSSGGQFALDYSITGGSGLFAGATGFGLSFFEFNPASSFDNYSESGLLLFDVPQAVPEPGTLPLLAGSLLGLWALRRKPLRRS